MNEELLKEVLSDSDFVQKLLNLESPEEVQATLKEKGVELTLEEIAGIQQALENQENGELSDDDLEDVAGGSVIGTIAAVIGIIGVVMTAADQVNNWTRRRW